MEDEINIDPVTTSFWVRRKTGVGGAPEQHACAWSQR